MLSSGNNISSISFWYIPSAAINNLHVSTLSNSYSRFKIGFLIKKLTLYI